MMKTVIFVPVDDRDAGAGFYRDVMGFEQNGPDFHLPEMPSRICLNLMQRDPGQNGRHGEHGVYPGFPLFECSIETNFLSYCQTLLDRGVRFKDAGSHPGGYWAEILDPFGNSFYVTCPDWGDINYRPDPFGWG